jgi:tetratricopeptide (TPR) repeat protein
LPVRTETAVAPLLRVACAALLSACVGSGPKPAAAPDTLGVGPIVTRAEAARAQGDYTAAIDDYKAAIERTPWNAQLRQDLVACYAARAEKTRTKPGGSKGLAASEADLRAALKLEPKEPALKRSLAAVLLEEAGYAKTDEEIATLRGEARELAPELEAQAPVVRKSAEVRIDLAYDLIERGQLDAGIDQLEALVKEDPGEPGGTRLLAQAYVRKGGVQNGRADYEGAQQSFTRAVELYAQLAPCDGTRCDERELSMAHKNRIASALDGADWPAARAALAEAKALGLSYPDLEKKWPELKAPKP